MRKLTAQEKDFVCLVHEQTDLPPREASVVAFVLWLQQIGGTGEWDLYELVEH